MIEILWYIARIARRLLTVLLLHPIQQWTYGMTVERSEK